MVFTDNYLHEMPYDIQLLIVEYSKCKYHNICVNVATNSTLNKRRMYVSKRMHKKIMNLKYCYKNVEINSLEFIDRYKTAFFSLKNHIRDIISNLKIEQIRDILSYNCILDANYVYKMIYGDRINIIDYERELLLEIILNMYKTIINIKVV
jgi:hypothetical protein